MENIKLTQTVEKSDNGIVINTLYFIFLPLIFGELFFFFYICEMDIGLFKRLFIDTEKFAAAWLAGYEFFAVLFLFKLAISKE